MAQEATRTAPEPDMTSVETPSEATSDIAILAYQLWEERGRPDGSAEQDWLEAERQLHSRSSATR